jgi:hypothetical protein
VGKWNLFTSGDGSFKEISFITFIKHMGEIDTKLITRVRELIISNQI